MNWLPCRSWKKKRSRDVITMLTPHWSRSFPIDQFLVAVLLVIRLLRVAAKGILEILAVKNSVCFLEITEKEVFLVRIQVIEDLTGKDRAYAKDAICYTFVGLFK